METKEIKLPCATKEWYKNNSASYRITTDGTIEEITPENGKHYSLEEMYRHCNADLVEFIYLPDERVMIVDEEGALKSTKKQNWVATKIVADACEALDQCLTYFIYGNVMLIKEKELK